MCPIRSVRRSWDAAEGSGWTNEAEEAFQKIKKKLSKLQALTIPKGGELLMMQKSETINSVLFVERDRVQTPVSYILEDDFPEAQSQAGLRTYDVSYIRRKEVEGQVVRKFPEQEEQVLRASSENDEGTSEKLRKKQAATARAWRLYLRRETNKEGSGESMDYEALLAGLIASADKGMKDLHVFVSSKELVDQVEGNRVPRTMEAIKFRKEVMDATAPFH
ncbi:reverse transcriptase domain-containing protein, partial [Tanacetum coccineum]